MTFSLSETQSALGQMCDERYISIAPTLFSMLLETFQGHEDEGTAFGYLMWLWEHNGNIAKHRSVILSQSQMKGYLDEAVVQRKVVAPCLYTAHQILVRSLDDFSGDVDAAIRDMKGVAMPTVLCLLFLRFHQKFELDEFKEAAMQYIDDAQVWLCRYPGCLLDLPAEYQTIGKEVMNGGYDGAGVHPSALAEPPEAGTVSSGGGTQEPGALQ